MGRVRVESVGRLHLGLMDLHGGLGRKFGGIGVALERPRVVVEADRADELIVEGVDKKRAREFAERFYANFSDWVSSKAHLRVREAIPPHVGLGSGTQLALSVGTALARLHGLDLGAMELSREMGRARRSVIGTGAFESGGFLVDGGCKDGTKSIPIIFRYPFPSDWVFVIITPDRSRGLGGGLEDRAFDDLPSPSEETVGCICRLLVMKMLPSLVEGDIIGFGTAMTRIQRLVGDIFAPAQAGRYASDLSEELVKYTLAHGAVGAGQSSWGPAIYALVQGEDRAVELEKTVRWFTDQARVFHTSAANHGARVIIE